MYTTNFNSSHDRRSLMNLVALQSTPFGKSASNSTSESRWTGKLNKAERGQKRIKLAFLDWLRDGGCFDCGLNDKDVMQFDHVRGKRGELITSDYRQKSLAGGSRSINAYAGQPWSAMITELLKCDVVC